MIKKILNLFSRQKEMERDFSTFFRKASKAEKEKVLIDIVRKANQDQREMVERYNRINAKAAL
jgi:hypothetical protein